MAGKAVWEYRGDPEQSALLVQFANGTIQTPKDVRFTLYRNEDDKTPETKRQRILAADTDRLSYVGNNYSTETKNSPLCKYFIGVLNKATGKMEVYDAEHIKMQPVLKTDNSMSKQIEDATDQSTKTYREKVDALIEAFGTNRQKRALSSRKLNQVGSETLNKAMVKAAEEIIGNKGKTELLKEAMDTNEELSSIFLPSCNASADKPENVYKFDDLISPVEYEALESVSAAFKNITPEELQQMTEKKEHTLFVLQELREIKLAKDPDRQARVLWYLDMLIKFSQLKVAKRKDLITKGCPSIICANLMKNFSVIVYKDGRIQNSISGTMKSKIVAYVIALALHISNFQVDLTCLQRDLRLTENRIIEIAKAMRLKIGKINMFSDVSFEESHKIATLELPLIVYKPAGGMKKKRKM
ncbi:DNA-directed RNA polymerase I subunit RPA49 isoform X2 [Rana temporaria]|uniref:DNA-directed RNA polymerase I subunit RPA49 isoform X2 n=1 Tax=Rana temporaria TaxID=8407 RepID=UPI001AAD82B9|nr:DNA-directed RNA polymerase I subunit RPA49 isoform X2 [Rana temporaria]